MAPPNSTKAKEYAKLETTGSLRSFEHVETVGVPGGTVDVYSGRDDEGAFWVVDDDAGRKNLYPEDNAATTDEIIQHHIDLSCRRGNR